MLFSTCYPQFFTVTTVSLLLLVGCGEDKSTTISAPSLPKESPAKTVAQPSSTKEITAETVIESTLSKDNATSEKVAEVMTTPAKKATTLEVEPKSKASKAPVVVEKASRKKKQAIAKSKPNLEFDLIRHSFDTIQSGDVIDYKFEFTNTGKGPLVIESAKATCGCTQPSYPFIPIEPGEKGYIGVTYNSVGKEGQQKPLITVRSNASSEPIALMLTGFVEPKKKEEAKEKSVALDSLIKEN